jgi:hypothetical protein
MVLAQTPVSVERETFNRFGEWLQINRPPRDSTSIQGRIQAPKSRYRCKNQPTLKRTSTDAELGGAARA